MNQARAKLAKDHEELDALAGEKASVAVEHSILETLKNAVRAATHEARPDHRARP